MKDLTEIKKMKKQEQPCKPVSRELWKGSTWHFSLMNKQLQTAAHHGWRQGM